MPVSARSFDRRFRLALQGCGLAVLFIGCNDGGSTSTSSAPPPPPPPPPPAPVVAAAPRPVPKTNEKKPPPKASRNEAELPNVYVVGQRAPNYTAQVAPLPYGHAAYAAATPLKGTNASQFTQRSPPPRPRATQVHAGFELPEGFTIVEDGGLDEQGIPLRILCEADGAEMAFVPGGGFIQGVDGQTPESGPAHVAYVDGFYMDILEATVKQYEEFRTATLNTRRPQRVLNEFDPPDYPALGVNWRDAGNYARWAGKELPTEAEWEKAGRGVDGYEFPWGNGRAIWEHDRRPGQIDPVGTHPNDVSVYGILDLAGNAREWCSDWYAPDSYLQAKTPDGSPPRNPRGVERAAPPNARVLKGSGAEGWELWAREGVSMRDQLPNVGVRCVLRVELPEDVKAAEAQRAPRGDF